MQRGPAALVLTPLLGGVPPLYNGPGTVSTAKKLFVEGGDYFVPFSQADIWLFRSFFPSPVPSAAAPEYNTQHAAQSARQLQ